MNGRRDKGDGEGTGDVEEPAGFALTQLYL